MISFAICYLLLAINNNDLADSLYQSGYYYEAATEYERLLFFLNSPNGAESLDPSMPEKIVQSKIKFRLALSYLKSGEVEKGRKFLRDLIKTEFAHKAQLLLAQSHIGLGEYYNAELELYDFLITTQDSAEIRKAYQLLGWVKLNQKDYPKAINYFNQSPVPQVGLGIKKLSEYRGKSPTIALILSSLLPGTGEIYCGKYKTGFLSLLINGLSVLGIYYSLKNKNYIDAGVIFSIFFNRFYFGSRQNASYFAVEFNERYYRKKIEDLNHRYRIFSGLEE